MSSDFQGGRVLSARLAGGIVGQIYGHGVYSQLLIFCTGIKRGGATANGVGDSASATRARNSMNWKGIGFTFDNLRERFAVNREELNEAATPDQTDLCYSGWSGNALPWHIASGVNDKFAEVLYTGRTNNGGDDQNRCSTPWEYDPETFESNRGSKTKRKSRENRNRSVEQPLQR